MEAAQLVVKLLHYFGLLLEPAIINVLHNFAAFLKSEIDVETYMNKAIFTSRQYQRTLDGACG